MSAPGSPAPGAGTPRSAGGPACSTASRVLDEDLSATASLGRRWLLVEVAGAWGWNAWTQSPVLKPAVGRAIARRAEAAGMRVAAIRRPGRSRGEPRWRWAVVDTGPSLPSVRWGEAETAEGLLTVPLDGSTGTPSPDPVFTVCAHGRHDECCAVRGRTVAAQLAEAHPESTWECSHIGGDRFAATMMVFPEGLSYGRVDDLDPVAIIDRYLEGHIAGSGYRGRATYTHVEQAALAAAAEEYGDTRIEAFEPRSVTRAEDVDGRWTVRLSRGVEVLLRERSTGPVFTTCSATLPVRIRRYEVLSVRGIADALQTA